MKRQALLLGAALLSSCSAGNSSMLPAASPQSTPASTPTKASQGTATFSIAVPAKPAASSAGRQRPQYVSPSTGSVAITVVAVDGKQQSSPATVAKIAYGASGCTSDHAQPLSCTIGANVPAGENVTFTIATFASSNGTGAVLSSATLTKTIKANTVNTIPVTLGGVVNTVTLSPSTIHTVADGSTHTYLVTLEALDASGATIVGSAPFASPISISDENDPNGAVLVSQSSVTGPGVPFQVRYNGTKHLDDAKITASAGSAGSAVAQIIPFNVSLSNVTAPMGGQTQTATLSEVGFTGAFTASIDDSAVATTSLSATSNGTASLSIKPAPLGGSAGIATITVGDGTLTGNLNVHVTAPPLPGVQEFSVDSSQFAPFKLVALSSSALYFTNGAGRTSLGVFDTASKTATNLPLTIPGASFFSTAGIAHGSDGNVWVGASFVPAVCKIAIPSQAETCYSAGLPPGALVYGVASGPDGHIWCTITNFGGQSGVADIDPATGTITMHTNGMNATSAPYSIVAGSDGNMWFTDVGDQPAIGTVKIATGNITEFSGGLQPFNSADAVQSQPYYLAAAPGKLFVSDAAGYIGTFALSTDQYTGIRNRPPTSGDAGVHRCGARTENCGSAICRSSAIL